MQIQEDCEKLKLNIKVQSVGRSVTAGRLLVDCLAGLRSVTRWQVLIGCDQASCSDGLKGALM